jgi:hypothetical protein
MTPKRNVDEIQHIGFLGRDQILCVLTAATKDLSGFSVKVEGGGQIEETRACCTLPLHVNLARLA